MKCVARRQAIFVDSQSSSAERMMAGALAVTEEVRGGVSRSEPPMNGLES
jgi:hypothetical protein